MRYEKQADGQIVVLAEKEGGADGVSKLSNGMQPHDTVDMKALLKCTPVSDMSNTYHHNGTIDNGELVTVCVASNDECLINKDTGYLPMVHLCWRTHI